MDDVSWFDWLTLGVAAIGAVFSGAFFALSGHKRQKLILQIKSSERQALVNFYSKKRDVENHTLLRAILDSMSYGFGRPFTVKSFERSLAQSVIAVNMGVLVGSITTARFDHYGWDMVRFFLEFSSPTVALLTVWSILCMLIFLFEDSIHTCLKKLLSGAKALRRNTSYVKTYWVPSNYELTVICVTFAYILSKISDINAAYPIALTLASILCGNLVNYGIAGSAPTLLSIFFFAGIIDDSTVWLLFIYVFLFPISVATVNVVSYGISFRLMENTVRDHRYSASPNWVVGSLVRTLADLSFSILCLGALIGFFWLLLWFWGLISPNTQPLDPLVYWSNAMVNPLDGLALWIMCYTTLLPTLVHLFWTINFVLTRRSSEAAKIHQSLVDFPRHAEADQAYQAQYLADRIRAVERWAFVKAALLVSIGISVAVVVIWALVFTLIVG